MRSVKRTKRSRRSSHKIQKRTKQSSKPWHQRPNVIIAVLATLNVFALSILFFNQYSDAFAEETESADISSIIEGADSDDTTDITDTMVLAPLFGGRSKGAVNQRKKQGPKKRKVNPNKVNYQPLAYTDQSYFEYNGAIDMDYINNTREIGDINSNNFWLKLRGIAMNKYPDYSNYIIFIPNEITELNSNYDKTFYYLINQNNKLLPPQPGLFNVGLAKAASSMITTLIRGTRHFEKTKRLENWELREFGLKTVNSENKDEIASIKYDLNGVNVILQFFKHWKLAKAKSNGIVKMPTIDTPTNDFLHWDGGSGSGVKQRDRKSAEIVKLGRRAWRFGKAVSFFHLPYMVHVFNEWFVKPQSPINNGLMYKPTKIFVNLRDPIPRFLSNYLYFIGSERTKLVSKYGHVDSYVTYILNDKTLSPTYNNMLDKLSIDKNTMTLNDWQLIFEYYSLYLKQSQAMCNTDFNEMIKKKRTRRRLLFVPSSITNNTHNEYNTNDTNEMYNIENNKNIAKNIENLENIENIENTKMSLLNSSRRLVEKRGFRRPERNDRGRARSRYQQKRAGGGQKKFTTNGRSRVSRRSRSKKGVQRNKFTCQFDDLIRNNLAISCYVVPLMYWFINLDNSLINFRVVQTELFLEYPSEHVNRILCWSTNDQRYCNKIGDFMNEHDRFAYASDPANKHAANKNNEKISHQNVDKLKSLLNVCHTKLEEMLQVFPEMAVMQFNFSRWQV